MRVRARDYGISIVNTLKRARWTSPVKDAKVVETKGDDVQQLTVQIIFCFLHQHSNPWFSVIVIVVYSNLKIAPQRDESEVILLD